MPQAFLKLGIAAKSQLGDEPGDRRRADAGAIGESGDALEAGDRIRGEQDAGQPAFGRAEGVEALPDHLGDAFACYGHFISSKLTLFRNVLDKTRTADRNLVALR